LPQAKKKSRATVAEGNPIAHRLSETFLILTVLVAVYLVACLASYDPTDPGPFNPVASDQVSNIGRVLGAWLANFSLFLTGYLAYSIPLLLIYIGWLVYARAGKGDEAAGALEWFARFTGLLLFILSATGLAHLHTLPPAGSMPAGGGGVIGLQIATPLLEVTGALGSTLFLLALLLVGLTLFAGISWFGVMDAIGRYTLAAFSWLGKAVAGLRDWFAGRRAKAQRVEIRKADSERRKTKSKPRIEPQVWSAESQPSVRAEREKQQPLFKNLPAGSLPPLELLDDPPEQAPGYSTEVLEALSRQVELKLADFGVQVDVVEVHPGPVITRFELQPAPGVKSSQISNLAKDLARGLSVISVRVVEVIPGKTTIGLEIPNTVRQTVYLSEILRSEVYERSNSALTLGLGKSIGGNPVVADVTRFPHLLVAGTTGSGKSVALNAMILSFLYKSTPEQVRLIMIDPKMLELSVYEGIPHLLAPVVTDMKEAANALRWCVAEMERRYRLMATLGVDGHPRGAQHLGLQPQGARGRREGQPVAGSVLGAGGRGRPGGAARARDLPLHRRGGRRICRPDDDRRQEDRGTDRPPGPEGASRGNPPGGRHAAAVGRRHHRSDQSQHPDAYRLPGLVPGRLPDHPRSDGCGTASGSR
jgi:S-DNA-T family DNA segregation ATPase FtsK/SpoIIIE